MMMNVLQTRHALKTVASIHAPQTHVVEMPFVKHQITSQFADVHRTLVVTPIWNAMNVGLEKKLTTLTF